jgi:hypothetical protein
MRVAMLVLVALAQSGCSTTLPPIQGRSSDGSEIFTRIATDSADASSGLSTASNKDSSSLKAFSVADVAESGVPAVYAVPLVADARGVSEPQTHLS